MAERHAERCTHYVCRCARAAELATMGLTREAIAVHSQSVPCRLTSDTDAAPRNNKLPTTYPRRH